MPLPKKSDDLKRNDTRLEFRLHHEERDLIEQAASASGQSLTDYAVSSLVRLSYDVLERHQTTRMTVRDRDRFLQLLDEDREPNAALVRAAERYQQRNGS